MRVPCVYSTENITPPQAGEACETDAAPQGLSCAGYGASMLVTASFGLHCAQAAIEPYRRPAMSTAAERAEIRPSEHALAWVFGQPVTDMPQDLFIPPDALKVVLHSFQGPLDLLLYLIRKQNIDVLDIPMMKITEQYLHYIAQMDTHQFDLAAEYLLMAAVLIEIKSRLLLPQPENIEEDEAADPRAELVRRLLAYEQMKRAAAGLDALPRAGRDFAWAICRWKSLWKRACPMCRLPTSAKPGWRFYRAPNTRAATKWCARLYRCARR
jgi:hypothetical protein